VHCERPYASSGTNPVPDDLAREEKRARRAPLVSRPFSSRHQRAVSDPHGRHIQNGAQVDGEAGPARVIAARPVDEQDVGPFREKPYGFLEQRTLAKRQKPCLVAERRTSEGDGRPLAERCAGPAGISSLARAGFGLREADEASRHREAVRRPPGRGVHRGELGLEAHQGLGRRGPEAHTRNTGGVRPESPEDLVEACRVEGVRDARVLEAVGALPREDFVPPQLRDDAYLDLPLPIAHGQVTTQPSLVARMVEALALSGSERVLEVGTGYGWQTALLARLATRVYSVERFSDVAETAQAHLFAHTIENVEVVIGDGSEGLAQQAPFDAVLVSAAYPSVPAPLAEQLGAGGRLVQPIGPGGADDVWLFERGELGLVPRKLLTGARFVPLIGRYAYRE
jgi:protein-L-isoaspartate(D-aspartate) O-methyltransferase